MSGARGPVRAQEACSGDFVPRARGPLARPWSAARACLVLVALTLPLAGCGQKGPLVLPDGDSSGAPAASDDEEESAAARAARGGDGTGNGADGR